VVRTFEILNARVLIVDDQEAHVLLLERMLCGAGYTSVDSTIDPREVCALHRKNRYAAILLDLKMPGMDGFQVMERLKEVEADDNVPVLVITAEPGHKLRALRAGARDFVTKPLDLPEVLIRVHNMIEVRLLRLETELLRAQLADA
jgi:DNA-binding response OmpR family regulator